jgi:hypothetical protein
MKRLPLPKKQRRRRKNRKWFGSRPRKKGWKSVRLAFNGQRCQVHRPHGADWQNQRTSLDHIIPERLILSMCPGQNPHEKLNLMPNCDMHHGIKGGADAKLCRGDKLGFLEVLRTNGWDMDRVEKALAHYGF